MISADEVQLRFATSAGVLYVIEFADSLSAPWDTLQAVTGDGTAKTITDPLSGRPQRYYRLRVQ